MVGKNSTPSERAKSSHRGNKKKRQQAQLEGKRWDRGGQTSEKRSSKEGRERTTIFNLVQKKSGGGKSGKNGHTERAQKMGRRHWVRLQIYTNFFRGEEKEKRHLGERK